MVRTRNIDRQVKKNEYKLGGGRDIEEKQRERKD